MKRALLLILALLSSTLAFVLLSLALLLGTAPGARVLWSEALIWVPGLEEGMISGSLTGGLTLEGFRYRQGGIELAVERFELQWQPRALFLRRLHVTRLAASGVELVITSYSIHYMKLYDLR